MEPDLEPTMEDWGWIMTVKTNKNGLTRLKGVVFS